MRTFFTAVPLYACASCAVVGSSSSLPISTACTLVRTRDDRPEGAFAIAIDIGQLARTAVPASSWNKEAPGTRSGATTANCALEGAAPGYDVSKPATTCQSERAPRAARHPRLPVLSPSCDEHYENPPHSTSRAPQLMSSRRPAKEACSAAWRPSARAARAVVPCEPRVPQACNSGGRLGVCWLAKQQRSTTKIQKHRLVSFSDAALTCTGLSETTCLRACA
eukprot:354316-Chlamydomonas_euryale.AAC.6